MITILQGRNRTTFFAAWLALFAIAMLFVAPAVSRTLAHRAACHHDTMAMSPSMADMHPGMAMTARCEPPSPMMQRMMSGKGMSPMEEIVCGYCQLLAHFPFIELLLAALLWLLLRFILRTSLPPLACAPLFRPWFPQRARAPPAVFIL
ncbi:DUF2946 domain-containing protein [Pluralibacter gergoviae]|uniref:DUF2946 domain-containing protein n=1 Tax=Pluralibacter gergoviae TaxID=61647 RepID=UPI000A3C0BC3|nr:DUF2946 domain-containing protein [Pluralibacter gergoviae]OUF47721.1 hypothetical protein AZ034_002243 [Pluralibacter gergoviae]OUF56397.1 hypothetical protein AZ044_002661 [Pluralibacter gergoviae]